MNNTADFIAYCDSMMIATEKGLNIFHNETLAEVKQKIKAGETKFTCNCNIDGRNVPCNIDITNFKGSLFKTSTILGRIRYLLNNGRYIKRALNYKYFDKTGMAWSKNGDRIKDMKYYWKGFDLKVGKRNEVEVGGVLHFENIGKDINYQEISPLVEKFIARDTVTTSYMMGAVGGFA